MINDRHECNDQDIPREDKDNLKNNTVAIRHRATIPKTIHSLNWQFEHEKRSLRP